MARVLRYVTTDAMGSVTSVLSSTGEVLERRSYDAFGKMTCMLPDGTPVAASPTGLKIGFQGQQMDELTGMYQMGYRWYLPVLGRWVSHDPIGLEGGTNLYSSFGNNPISAIDPLGQRLVKISVNAFIPRREDLPNEWKVMGSSDNPGETESNVDWFDEPFGYRAPLECATLPLPPLNIWDFGRWQFAGDRRTFGEDGTSRLSITFFVETDSIGLGDCKIAEQVPIKCILGNDVSRRRFVTLFGKFEVKNHPANQPEGYIERFDCGNRASIDMKFSRGYPYTPKLLTPDIDIHLKAIFERNADGSIRVTFQGMHNRFPCYEILLDGACKYKWSPTSSGPSILNLGRDWEIVSEEPIIVETK